MLRAVCIVVPHNLNACVEWQRILTIGKLSNRKGAAARYPGDVMCIGKGCLGDQHSQPSLVQLVVRDMDGGTQFRCFQTVRCQSFHEGLGLCYGCGWPGARDDVVGRWNYVCATSFWSELQEWELSLGGRWTNSLDLSNFPLQVGECIYSRTDWRCITPSCGGAKRSKRDHR